MSIINVNLGEYTGNVIKPLHGVNRPEVKFNDTIPELKSIGIPFARLHDCGGAFGRNFLVDIPNVFRDFNADPDDPAAYDFVFTDAYLKTLVDSGMDIIYRLGVTIENWNHIKAYRTFPPEDSLKWAKICEHIVRHYNEGWNNGFHYNITYWEIWNEPDNPNCWSGTKEEFLELYRVSSNYLKKCFPELKIGGYASCGFYYVTRGHGEYADGYMDWINSFIKYVTDPKTACVLDFFSFHLYFKDPKEIGIHADYARKMLDESGLKKTEIVVDEWNYIDHSNRTKYEFVEMKEMPGAAFTAGALCVMQKKPVDVSTYYDANVHGAYCGLFYTPSKLPAKPYFALKAFNQLYRLEKETVSDSDNENVYVSAAADGAGKAAVMISYDKPEKLELELKIANAPAEISVWKIDEKVSFFVPVKFEEKMTLEGRTILLLLAGKDLEKDADIPDDPYLDFARLLKRT